MDYKVCLGEERNEAEKPSGGEKKVQRNQRRRSQLIFLSQEGRCEACLDYERDFDGARTVRLGAEEESSTGKRATPKLTIGRGQGSRGWVGWVAPNYRSGAPRRGSDWLNSAFTASAQDAFPQYLSSTFGKVAFQPPQSVPRRMEVSRQSEIYCAVTLQILW